MRGQRRETSGWDDEYDEGYSTYGGVPEYGYSSYDDHYAQMEDSGGEEWDGEERGLMLQPEHSLVGVSKTVTHHGVPLLSYTRTMNRFYTTRKQRLSLGRFKCEVCGERIRWWAWETGTGTRTHDGCYERLAWTWTNLYAQQQKLASQGLFE